MKKFAHEKSKLRDIVRERGADPIWASIRKDDEYIRGTTTVQFILSAQPDQGKASGSKVAGGTSSPISSPAPRQTSKGGASSAPSGSTLGTDEHAANAQEAKEKYIKQIVNSTNSFPHEFMVDKENREMIRRLRADKAAQSAAKAKAMNDRPISSLSHEARDVYVNLCLAHPDTRIGTVNQPSEDTLKIEIVGFNRPFFDELKRAVISYDNQIAARQRQK